MIERLGFASVTVKDPDAALSFYVEKLGFEKRRDYHFPRLPRFLTVAPKNQKEVELVLVQAGASNVRGAPAGHTGMVFWTDNYNREYERLKAKGVNFTEGPEKMPFGIQAMFMDIDGNLFALSRPSEGLT